MHRTRNVALLALVLLPSACFATDNRAATESHAPRMVMAIALSATTSSQREQFMGTYRYAGTPEQEQARRAAIDRAVASTFFAIRSKARSRISATTQVLDSYSFSFDSGKIHVLPSSRPEMISPEDGEPADYVYNGMRSRFTQQLAGDRLSQVFTSESGRRENEFTLSHDGHLLTLKVTVSSPRLTTPVVYTLSYKKTS